MDIKIEKLKLEDAKKLFEFEIYNKEYFEKFVPSRSNDYFNYDSFLEILNTLLIEQQNAISFFYLIKDMNDNILGRINLTDINYSEKSVDLGYRIGKDYIGRGIASKALNFIINAIDTNTIEIINSKTTTNNIGSQKVMLKNNFKFLYEDKNEFIFNEIREKFVYYKLEIKK
ncbi:GNAT family N-acetyltransferase [Miniphocaeibacter massiliensis]|uniref:GNAT family N-acetyltransferase n=1 Tax=Miniphocaeibacter massiliensis TaxID=2041841 RepID=UPI000C1BA73E|nr:GNAT family N-acetyltransferase [Miniphocaeibacter massiliensis]